MSNYLSAFTTTYQCMLMDYPIEAMVRCAMDFCDDLYLNDGGSTDGTKDLIYTLQNEYGKDRIKIYETVWPHDRDFWTVPKNFLLDKIPQENGVLCLDADDLLHEDDITKVKAVLPKLDSNMSISFSFIHFYGLPDLYIEGPAWYKYQTRLWKSSSGIRYKNIPGGCADDLMYPDGRYAHVQSCRYSGITMYHYGNCRAPQALGMKARRADDLYQCSERYKDGSLPEPLSFDYGVEKLNLNKFESTHPKYVKEWYESHKNQATKYIAKEGDIPDKLWCFK